MTDTKTIEKLRVLAIQEAIALFEGDEMAAMKWMRTAQRGLGNRPPQGLMGTSMGIEKVRTLIGRLEHGVLT
ncbi:MbcA/ParS/Xre antitoxin family protein [Marinobacter salsuginis]|jgi:putative toxin-antitoxin system antitoxin component (TIGR02293 family)|uniref:MbcA/ParS/Xre antitoxin family protein n=1 Tax=Marinobacter salsuginis TaxID=418719 RepID=UPI00273E4A97|nr:MbcA/ParS/Xre antitoxin family protein [Marinobacter salsuginis]|tara:strand:- start:3 stop:218 length:216 start_codon:yes stop_codon:yes gene_type:complete